MFENILLLCAITVSYLKQLLLVDIYNFDFSIAQMCIILYILDENERYFCSIGSNMFVMLRNFNDFQCENKLEMMLACDILVARILSN